MNKCEKFVRIIPNTIKDKSWKLLSFMERETRLELATSSLARRHSTTELPPHVGYQALWRYFELNHLPLLGMLLSYMLNFLSQPYCLTNPKRTKGFFSPLSGQNANPLNSKSFISPFLFRIISNFVCIP